MFKHFNQMFLSGFVRLLVGRTFSKGERKMQKMNQIKKGFLLAILFWVLFPAGTQAETRFEKSARQKRQIAKTIIWPRHEPLVFYLRRGRRMENWPQFYQAQHAPENVRMMANAGSKMERLHFYKGYGLDVEMPEIEKTKQMADLMHKLGMQVSIYVAGTMFTEAFYKEVPEAANWEQKDQLGRAVPYFDTQTYRHFPCPHEPAYRDYIKKVLDIGIDNVKANQIFFDNIQLQPEPKSCRCPRCLKAFTQFIKERYPTQEQAFRRFGFRNLDLIQVNQWYHYNRPEDLAVVDDPVLQEWIRFRCKSLADYCGDFYQYIKSKNPAVSVGFNLKGIYGINRMWRKAIYHPFFAGRCDFMPFDIPGMDARIDEETGALVSEICSYKAARGLGMTCQHSGPDLEYAVYMAFNLQRYLEGFGYHGGPFKRRAGRLFTPLTEFFREYNDRFFTDTEMVADVAVLHSFPSMAYSISRTRVPTILTEQVLIQHKVPFAIIFDEQIDTLNKYQAIILPGQECLSKENIDKLTAYVRSGGTLVFTDNTAEFNDWREKRSVNPMFELMGIEPSSTEIQTIVPQETRAGTGIKAASVVLTRRLGKGKMVYIPKVIPAVEPGQANKPFEPSRWVLPTNHYQIYYAVKENLSDGLAIVTEAPLTTVMEILNRPKTKETIIHFINFEQDKGLMPFQVQLKKQYKDEVKSVSFYSPEFDEPQPVEFFKKDGRIIFTVPSMKLYSMIVVSH